MLPVVIKGLVLVFLAPLAWEDYRTQKLHTGWLVLHTCLSFGLFAYQGDWLQGVGGMLVGVVLLLLAKFSREKLGRGDGWLFVVCGGYLGFFSVVTVLLLALFLCSIWNGGRVLLGRASWNTEVPFVPYVWWGYLLYLCFF